MQVVKAGATDVTVTIRIIDSGDGTPETGVTSASSGIDLWYRNGATAAKTSITEADLSALTDAHSDGGMLHIDDGYYRLDLPDAAVPAAGAITVVGGGVTGMIVLGTAIQAAPAADVTHLLGTAWLTPGTAGTPDVNVKLISGDSGAADNAESFFDGTGYAGTNNVIPLVTTTTTATNVTTVNGLAANVITAASIATGAIDADAIAADAIGASELAADAVAEIADAVWDEAAAGHVGAGTFGEQCGTDIDAILVDTGTTLQAELDGIQADTEDIQSRIPAALVGGRIDANVGAISGDVTAADNLESYTDGTTPMPVNATQLSGDSGAADNAEAFFDGTGYVGGTAKLTVDVTKINGDANAAARLALSAANMIPGTVDTTAFTATTTILESDDITEATADHYNGRLILFTSGALVGQVTDVTDYELNGGRGRFTYTATTEAPANDVTFILV